MQKYIASIRSIARKFYLATIKPQAKNNPSLLIAFYACLASLALDLWILRLVVFLLVLENVYGEYIRKSYAGSKAEAVCQRYALRLKGIPGKYRRMLLAAIILFTGIILGRLNTTNTAVNVGEGPAKPATSAKPGANFVKNVPSRYLESFAMAERMCIIMENGGDFNMALQFNGADPIKIAAGTEFVDRKYQTRRFKMNGLRVMKSWQKIKDISNESQREKAIRDFIGSAANEAYANCPSFFSPEAIEGMKKY